MVSQTPWVERKFNFDFPVGLYPNLVERLRGAPARLEEVLRPIPKERLVRKGGESWSILEHGGHMYCIDALHETRLDEYLERRDELTAAKMTNKPTYEADFNNQPLEDVLRTFRENRLRIVVRLEQVDDETAAHAAFHPRLKVQMRLVDMLLFAAEHDDHHFALMNRLIREG